MAQLSQDLAAQFNAMINNGQVRTQSAVNAIRQANYPPGQLLADVFGTWIDVAEFWSVPAKSVYWGGPTAVQLSAAVGAKTAEGVLPVPWLTDPSLKTTDLVGFNNPADVVPQAEVSVKVFQAERVLLVKVAAAKAFSAETYTGSLLRTADGTKVAQVILVSK